MKFLILSVFVALASAADVCQLHQTLTPGMTVTTTTTTTTTASATGAWSGASSGAGLLINPSDLQTIRSTWEVARKDGDVAPAILYKFLEQHPEYQKKFPTFANVPMSELKKNGNFLAQAYTIMAGLNVIIQSSGSQELIAQEVSHLGIAHFERGVSVPMFEQFARVIVNVLEEEIKLDTAAKNAWSNGLSALIEGISKSLKTKKDVPDPQTHLTPHQIEDVRKVWEKVRGDRNSMVSQIFIKLFKDRPTLQQKFSSFASVPLNDLPTNEDYRKQVSLVADRLDSIISEMDIKLKIMGQIQYMAYSHKPRSVGRQEFQDFGRYMSDILRSKGISADDMESWDAVQTTLAQSIAKIQGI
jgi:hypothetical protein